MRNVLTHPPHLPLIAPSILAASFARMAEDCVSVLAPESGQAADLLHLDVMDGHFVPNLTLGPDLCRWLRRELPDATLDVHVMVTDPTRYIAPFRDAGADHLTFHIEPALSDYRDHAGGGGGPLGEGYNVLEVADQVHDAGMSAGLAINPPTPVEAVLDHLDPFEMILVMSVNPGFGGQKFIEPTLEKTRLISKRLRPDQRLQMDGGVAPETAQRTRDAGCDVLVAGSAIFGLEPPERPGAIALIRGELQPAQ